MRCDLTPDHDGPHAATLDRSTIVTWTGERSQQWRADNPPSWIIDLSWSQDFLPWHNHTSAPNLTLVVDERPGFPEDGSRVEVERPVQSRRA